MGAAYIAAGRAACAGDGLQGCQRIADDLEGRPSERQHGCQNCHAAHRQEVRRIPGAGMLLLQTVQDRSMLFRCMSWKSLHGIGLCTAKAQAAVGLKPSLCKIPFTTPTLQSESSLCSQ